MLPLPHSERVRFLFGCEAEMDRYNTIATTIMVQKEVIDALTAAGIRDKVRVMVGGGLVTQAFADSIGVDCYTPDAVSAANEAVRLLA